MTITDNQMPLGQYLTGAINGLKKGEISPSEFATTLFHYTEGKAFFVQNLDLADILLNIDDPAGATEVALEIAGNPYAFLVKESPGTPHTEDEQTSATKILGDRKSEIDSFAMQPEEFQASLLQKRQEAVKKQTSYISQLVDKFGKNLREEQRQSALNSRDAVIEELKKAPRANSLEEAYKIYKQRIEESVLLNEEARELAYQIIEDKEFRERALALEQKTKTITREYLEHSDNPPELVTSIIDTSFSEQQPASESIAASRIQYIAGKPSADTKNIPVKQAYPEYNQGSNKEDVISHAYSARIIAATKGENKDKLAKTIAEKSGGVASESSVLHILKKAEDEAIERSGGMVKNWTNHIDEPPNHQEKIKKEGENYLIGAITREQTPTTHGMFKAVAFARSPQEFHFSFNPDLSIWALNLGRRPMESGLLKTGASVAAKKAGTEFLLKLGFNATSWVFRLSTPIGWAVTVASMLWRPLQNLGGKALSSLGDGGFAGTAIINAVKNVVGGSYRDPNENNAALFALAIAVTPFLLAFFITITTMQTQKAMFFPVGTGGSGSSEENGNIIDCNDPSTKASNPVCNFTPCVGDCRWPTSGIITQGPNATCGSHKGGTDANAIDIATGGGGVPVYAMLTGTVTSIHSDCVDNTGNTKNSCGKSGYEGYGNHVVVSGVDKDGIPYSVIFGHLSSAIDIQDVDPVTPGVQVVPTSQVGIMDQTGTSSGDHLHFGVLSGGNVLNLVPATPGLEKCNISCGSCPGQPVSAGG